MFYQGNLEFGPHEQLDPHKKLIQNYSCDTDLLSNGTISNLVLAGGVSKLPGYYEDTKNRIGISGIPLKVIQRAPRKSLLRKFGNRI